MKKITLLLTFILTAFVAKAQNVVYIVGDLDRPTNATYSPADSLAINYLEKTGYSVLYVHADTVAPEDTVAQDLIVISNSVKGWKSGPKAFAWTEKPVITGSTGSWSDYGLADVKAATSKDSLWLNIIDNTHPIFTGLPQGDFEIAENTDGAHDAMNYIGDLYLPSSNSPDLLATIASGDDGRPTWVLFEKGDSLNPATSGVTGFPADGVAPGVRITLPMRELIFDTGTPYLTTLFLNSVDYALDAAINATRPTVNITANVPDTVNLLMGEILEVTPMIHPSNSTEDTLYSSQHADTATFVDGVITAVGKGTTTVSILSTSGVTKDIVVIVGSIDVTGVSLVPASATFEVDEFITLSALIEPEDASDKTVTWESSAPAVASVDENGLVTGLSVGTATITATTNDQGLQATADITVTEAVIGNEILYLYGSLGGPMVQAGYTVYDSLCNLWLTKSGYNLTHIHVDDVTLEDANGKDLIIISNSAKGWKSGGIQFAWSKKPVIIGHPGFYDDFGLTTNSAATGIDTVYLDIVNDTHPITNGLTTGHLKLAEGSGVNATYIEVYESVSNSPDVLGSLIENGDPSWVVFDKGDSLHPDAADKEGFPEDGLAVATRVTLPVWKDAVNIGTTPEFVTLYLNSVDYAFDAAIDDVRAVVDMKLNTNEVVLEVGGNRVINPVLYPSNANGEIVYASNDESVATFVDGTITAATVGQTTVTMTTNGMEHAISVDVVESIINATGVSIDPVTAKVNIGETLQLNKTVSPAEASDKTVSWSSSDEAVATVDANGLVSAVSNGTTTITATTTDGDHEATAEIEVVTPVNSILVSPADNNIEVDETVLLTVIIQPSDASDKSVTFESNDTDVVTVDENGLVTAIGAGTATVTITTVDGGLTKTSTFTVTEPVSVSEIDEMGINVYPNPVKDYLNVNGSNIERIQIINFQGAIIEEFVSPNEVTRIDFNNSGMYIIRIVKDKNVASTTIVVE